MVAFNLEHRRDCVHGEFPVAFAFAAYPLWLFFFFLFCFLCRRGRLVSCLLELNEQVKERRVQCNREQETGEASTATRDVEVDVGQCKNETAAELEDLQFGDVALREVRTPCMSVCVCAPTFQDG
jgi:hypothetical protein